MKTTEQTVNSGELSHVSTQENISHQTAKKENGEMISSVIAPPERILYIIDCFIFYIVICIKEKDL